eukprot:scaffold4513_cov37-Cyclotella_meneghiniana.AAC.1
MCAYAEIVGVALDWHRRLSVISVCGSSLSHRLGGKLSAVPASTLRKWALKLRIATSAALRLWHPGGTNSSENLHFWVGGDQSLDQVLSKGPYTFGLEGIEV